MKIETNSNFVTHIPDVTFGKQRNRELLPSERVEVKLRIATLAERDRYVEASSVTEQRAGKGRKAQKNRTVTSKSKVNYDYKSAIEKNVISIANLETENGNINTPKELLDIWGTSSEAGTIINDCFLKICGIHDDDEEEEDEEIIPLSTESEEDKSEMQSE